MATNKINQQKPKETCEGCDNCIYICEGDFICDKESPPKMIISDWEPTDDFLWCKIKKSAPAETKADKPVKA